MKFKTLIRYTFFIKIEMFLLRNYKNFFQKGVRGICPLQANYFKFPFGETCKNIACGHTQAVLAVRPCVMTQAVLAIPLWRECRKCLLF